MAVLMKALKVVFNMLVDLPSKWIVNSVRMFGMVPEQTNAIYVSEMYFNCRARKVFLCMKMEPNFPLAISRI